MLVLIASGYIAHISIRYNIQYRDDPAAMHIALAGVSLFAIAWACVVGVFPRLVGRRKDRLPESAVKYADRVAKEFPEAAEALEDWKKVALKEDDGTRLQSWAYYFEQLSEKKKTEARAREILDKIKAEYEQLCLKKPE